MGRFSGLPEHTRELETQDNMAKGKTLFAAAVAAASLSAFAGTSQAVVYTEGPGDAAQTLSTPQVVGSNATGFTGTIGGSQDADLYKFTIATAGKYTFSDNNSGTYDITAGGQLDTAIFLFSSTGTALYTNDDASGTSVESAFTETLAAGTYYFGISLSGNEPVNSNNQLLFAGYPNGDTTAVRGPASGLNPTTEANFNGQSYSSDIGVYSVTISAVPEPSTWAVVGASTVALAFVRRRRVA